MSDPALEHIVSRLMHYDIAALAQARSRDRRRRLAPTRCSTASAIPQSRHLLSQIAWDGSQKLPYRLLDTVQDALGQWPQRRTSHGARRRLDRVRPPQGIRRTRRSPIPGRYAPAKAATGSDDVAEAMLGLRQVFPERLATDPRFRHGRRSPTRWCISSTAISSCCWRASLRRQLDEVDSG